jgi:hypothetical protein
VIRLALILGLSTLLGAVQAPPAAQGREGTRPGGARLERPRGDGPNRNPASDPRFMARLYHFRLSRIQQVLGLPEDRARVLAERWGRWDREHMDRGAQAAELRRQFNQVLLGPEREEDKNAKLKPLLEQFLAIRQQQESGRRQFEEEVRAGLTPAQQARLILVMDEIQQRLREALRESPKER